MDNKYGLYKRIMKRDLKAINEIETLEEAKEILKMVMGSNQGIKSNNGLYPFKNDVRMKIKLLQETVSTLILDNGVTQECLKDRCQFFERKGFNKESYEVININNISNDIINNGSWKEYYAKNIWVIV